MIHYYNRKGEPIGHELWAQMLEDDKYRVVEHDRLVRSLDDGRVERCWISTLWLGLDHDHDPGKPNRPGPVIFETMRQFEYSEDEDTTVLRYSTEADAIAGHGVILSELLRGDWLVDHEQSREPSPEVEAGPNGYRERVWPQS